MNKHSLLRYSVLGLILIAFIISNFSGNIQLKSFVFISLLLACPHEIHNKWTLSLFAGLFIYELFDMFIRSGYFYSATDNYLILTLGIMAVIGGLSYQRIIANKNKEKGE